MKKIFFFLLLLTYLGGGILHFIFPDKYLWLMPPWMPYPMTMVYVSGVAELIIGIGLYLPRYRNYAAIACATMLFCFLFLIHLPQAIEFVNQNHPLKVFSIIRIPLQFVLIWWVWIYRKYETS